MDDERTEATPGDEEPTVGLDDPAEPPPRPPIEPEGVDAESAAFVVAGALLTVVVVTGVV
jgi:hypothetical protein